MPDRTLSDLLAKIRAQQPRQIGLDLFRDVRVTSPFLSDEENKKAYNELEAIFSSTPNLIGIEKVLPPIVKSSQLLKKLLIFMTKLVHIQVDGLQNIDETIDLSFQ